MKILKMALIVFLMAGLSQSATAQFWKKLAKHASEKVEKEGERRVERRVDKTIDKAYDETEDEIDGKHKKKKKSKKSKDVSDDNASDEKVAKKSKKKQSKKEKKSHKPKVVWSKFDFVPGDTVIFEDMPDMDEENGEFPSRWDLYKGSAEVAEFDGQNVIMFLDGGGYIVPYLKDSEQDYLPDIFTIEFDVYFTESRTTANRYFISFYDMKNQRSQDMHSALVVYPNGIEYKETNKRYPGTENRGWSVEPDGKWRHISIAYTKGKFKAYMDDTRLVNVPHLKGNPTGLTIRGMRGEMYLKNIRIAKGGVKYYKRVLSDGKIIVNGIKFDVNKATLKPESMGPINRIYKLMKKQPELKFSVEGHTDSDGDEASNLKLSKARAKTVMNKLISLGIDKSRLKYTGFGETKPLDNNGTPEGKANNRRVEFVKF